MKASARRFKQLPKRFLAIAGAITLGATAITLTTPPAEASLSLLSATKSKLARGRVPGRRRGGARRGSCSNTQTPLVAIVAATEVDTETLPETYVGGITAAEYPTFWFDVPYSLTNELTAEFVLQDDLGQDVYRATSAEFATAGQTPGVMGIALPPELAPLEIGKVYQWYFKVNCGSETPPYVQGGIERVAIAPRLANQLRAATPLEQAALFQENELWYDAVTILAPRHRAEPDNSTIQAIWNDLLQSLDLQ